MGERGSINLWGVGPVGSFDMERKVDQLIGLFVWYAWIHLCVGCLLGRRSCRSNFRSDFVKQLNIIHLLVRQGLKAGLQILRSVDAILRCLLMVQLWFVFSLGCHVFIDWMVIQSLHVVSWGRLCRIRTRAGLTSSVETGMWGQRGRIVML